MAPRVAPQIAGTPPTHCASCFGQHPDRVHVDYQAAYDGPVVEGGIIGENGEVLDRIAVTIDELVLCEECLRTGAELIGMTADDGTKAALIEANRTLSEKNAGLSAYVEQLKATIAANPDPPKPKAKTQTRKAAA